LLQRPVPDKTCLISLQNQDYSHLHRNVCNSFGELETIIRWC